MTYFPWIEERLIIEATLCVQELITGSVDTWTLTDVELVRSRLAAFDTAYGFVPLDFLRAEIVGLRKQGKLKKAGELFGRV